MKIRVIIIGNEVLSGRVRDVNLKLVATRIKALGWSVESALVLPDDVDVLAEQISSALEAGLNVITSGGLGPTSDDLTRQGLARALGVELVEDPEIMRLVRRNLSRIGHRETPLHRAYSLRPKGFEIVENPLGLAPGLLLKGEKSFVLALPGVPMEAEAVLENALEVLAKNPEKQAPDMVVAVAGMTEAEISEKLKGLLPEETGFYPKEFEVIIRWPAKTAKQGQELRQQVADILGNSVYSFRDETLEFAVGRLLLEKGLSLAAAESCTGGLVSRLITSVPGASNYYRGGVVAYNPEIKVKLLGVDPKIIETHTVYSAQVAEAMAEGVAGLLGSDIGLSTTCVAGPGPDQGHPPGELFVGLHAPSVHRALHFRLLGDRHRVQRIASKHALNTLRLFLEAKEF